MSTRRNNGSHYENHQRASELQNAAAHAHRAAEQQRGQQDHLTASELSRQEREHLRDEQKVDHGVTQFGHDEIAALAYKYWEARGGMGGSPDDDWFRAVKELRSRNVSGKVH